MLCVRKPTAPESAGAYGYGGVLLQTNWALCSTVLISMYTCTKYMYNIIQNTTVEKKKLDSSNHCYIFFTTIVFTITFNQFNEYNYELK